MLKGDLYGLLVMDPQFFDGFISLLKVPEDLYTLPGIVVDLHDSKDLEHILG